MDKLHKLSIYEMLCNMKKIFAILLHLMGMFS